jgi:hypothetical protein
LRAPKPSASFFENSPKSLLLEGGVSLTICSLEKFGSVSYREWLRVLGPTTPQQPVAEAMLVLNPPRFSAGRDKMSFASSHLMPEEAFSFLPGLLAKIPSDFSVAARF